MDLAHYERIVRSEASARKYLTARCWHGRGRFCPKCRHDKIYHLKDGRMRCPACRYTFHDFSRRWLNTGGLSCRDWLRVVKLFELDLTANRMKSQLELSYNTIYKALTTLRLSILAGALDAGQLLSPDSGLNLAVSQSRAVESGRNTPYPVFGIIEKSGWVFLDLLPDMQAETVLHFNLNFKLKLTRMGNIVYTDRYRTYDALIFCGDDRLPLDYVNIKGKSAYVDGLTGSFWSFARSRLRRYNGVSPHRFPLYLKELEFRYNHRGEDCFELLVKRLCGLVPEFTQV